MIDGFSRSQRENTVPFQAMNPLQRIVAVLYCLVVACCCLWVPWHVHAKSAAGGYEPVGYGWLWAGPDRTPPGNYKIQSRDSSIPVIEVVVGPPPPGVPKPDVKLIALRFVLFTSLFFAALLAVKTTKRQAQP